MNRGDISQAAFDLVASIPQLNNGLVAEDLRILRRLNNNDKHRALAVTAAVPRSSTSVWDISERPPRSNASFFGEELKNGALVFKVFYDSPWQTLEPNLMIRARVTFGAREVLVERKDVEAVLAHLVKTIDEDIRGLFSPLFWRAARPSVA